MNQPPAIDMMINAEQAVAFLFPKGAAPTPPPGWAKTPLTWARRDGKVFLSHNGRDVGWLPVEATSHLERCRSAILAEWDAQAQQPLDKGTATVQPG